MNASMRISRRRILQGAAAASFLPLCSGAATLLAGTKTAPVAMKSGHAVQIRPHRGRTAIFVDGRPIPGMSFFGHDNATMVDAGVPVFVVNSGPIWEGKHKYKVTCFEDEVKAKGLDKAEDAWLLARLNCIGTPGWWADENPDDVCRYAHAPDRPGEFFPDHRNPRQASLASERWIGDVVEMIRALVDRVENGPFGHRVLGYMINGGGGEEWVYIGAQFGYIPDYAPPAKRYFQQWLRSKYGDQPWIENVRLPSEAARRRGQPAMLRDPAKDRLAIDFELCLSDILADCQIAFCAAVKEATGGKRLTGCFADYLLWQTGLINPLSTNAHLGLHKLLASPDVDFITGITSYDNREPGGPGSFMLPVESIQRAGKYYFAESDIRTHKARIDSTTRWTSTGLLGLAPLKDAPETIDVIRREFCHHLIHGAGWWYFGQGPNWFDFPEMQADLRAQARIARGALDWDMSSVAEVACLVSRASPAYHPLVRMQEANNYRPLLELQCDRATRELYRAGLPLDWLTTDDLTKNMERYRALFFYNATWLSTEQREAVETLKRDGRALIFVGYPGLATDSRLDVAAASRLVGMKFKLDEHRVNGRIAPRDYDDPALREVKTELTLGPGAVIGPRLIPDDPDAVVLAYWPDGAPAAAVKRCKDYTSYYFAVSPNHSDLFRTMCRDAGCFVYSTNNDILFVNKSLLMLHVVDCVQPLSLPRPSRVTNLFDNLVVAESAARFMPRGRGATHLYRVEPQNTT